MKVATLFHRHDEPLSRLLNLPNVNIADPMPRQVPFFLS